MSNDIQLEELQPILESAGCSGPYDKYHRCSALHCDHCGICDALPKLTTLIAQETTKAAKAAREQGNAEGAIEALDNLLAVPYGLGLIRLTGKRAAPNATYAVEMEAVAAARKKYEDSPNHNS